MTYIQSRGPYGYILYVILVKFCSDNIKLPLLTHLKLEEKSNEMIKNFCESSYKVNKNRINNAAYVSKNYIFII